MPFSKVVGHSQQISFIKKLIQTTSFPQTSIFSGPEGVGKKLIATETARILTGNDKLINVKVIGEEDIPKIDEVRESIQWMAKKPIGPSAKVLIIDKAENIKREVSNALLKLLEEPPPFGYIILITTSEQSLLPTIRSRARIFRFSRLTKKNVEYILNTLNINFDKRVLTLCGGSVGKAISMIEENTLSLIEDLIILLKSKKAEEKIVEFSLKFSKTTNTGTILFLDALESFIREKEVYPKWFEIIDRSRTMLKSNVKPRSVIEWMLISLLIPSEKSFVTQT